MSGAVAVAISEPVLSRLVPLVQQQIAVATVSQGRLKRRLLRSLASAFKVMLMAPAAMVMVAVEALIPLSGNASLALAVMTARRDTGRVSERAKRP